MHNPEMPYQPRHPACGEFTSIRLHDYHVLTWGRPSASRPPLVLLHGWMDVAASYQFMVDGLSPAFLGQRLLIAPDWRGFGRTRGPVCDHYVFADYLGDLEFLLDRYAGDQPVDLLGHSMGGHAAMLYAGTRPGRIRRLVNLEGFGVPAMQPAQTPERLARWIGEIKDLHAGNNALKTYASLQEVAARLMKTNRRLPPDKAEWIARQWAEPRQDAGGATRWHILGDAAHRVINPQPARAEDVQALYARISAPTLMVEASDNSLAIWSKGQYTLEEFHQRIAPIPKLRRATLPDCGHMLHHDQPQALAALVEQFLED